MKETNLPENAFRELKEGEQYEPLMKPGRTYREVTPWSIFWGLLMAVIFSAATAYLGLKVGQVFEAAIPITIIAVGLSGATHRKDPLGENVIIQSIGACSGMIVAGAIFTLPALYILQNKYPDLTVNFMQVFLASLLGGVLGILFLIPFRKYFVKDMHGKYPFPEATASTQVLLSGEKSGNQTMPLLVAGLIGGLYDFAVASFGAWTENFTSRVTEFSAMLTEKTKVLFSINTSAALLGMGYIVGLKYAAIICAGSVLVWWLIVPGIAFIFPDLEVAAGVTAASASAEQLFSYAKSIGIGGIAMAGIIGVVKSRGVIKSAFGLMGKVYLENVLGMHDPAVGLVNIGAEDTKGNALSKETYQLMKAQSVYRFAGNVEARDIPLGEVQVVVCDGFDGNLILKYTEGLSSAMVGMLKEEMLSSLRTKLGAALVMPALKRFKGRLSAENVGGAPLLGVNGAIIKAHGNSNATAFKNAIRQARDMLKGRVTEEIQSGLQRLLPEEG